MESRRKRVNALRDEDIETVLNESDYDSDPFGGDDDVADEDFNITEQRISSSSSSSISSDDENFQPDMLIERGRGRGSRRGRGRGSSAQRGSRDIASLTQQPNVEQDWEECSFDAPNVYLSQPSYPPTDRSSFSQIDYFRQYIDDAVIKNIVEKSNWSYFARHMKALNLTVEECNTYIAITMLMSCINYPAIRMYWTKKFRIPVIADSMPRNRFLLLRNSLKLVMDEDVPPDEKASDRLWKVRPLLTAMKKGCLLQEKTQDLSVDEMMIPFQGVCGMKQYCPGKPNPVGLKAFVLATPQGLVCDFDVYQGTTTYPDLADSNLSLAEKAVLTLAKNLVPGHIIYCDRYFTSEKLILALEERGLKCTGTLMKNRIPQSARRVIIEDKVMNKKPRGTWQIVVNKAKKLVVTKWLDSKPITFMSNIHADQTVDDCQRWSKVQRKYTSVPRPEVVKLYNRYMGGVDMADRMLSYCPYRYRTKKWTQRVISHFIDLAASNSWILYRQDKLKEGVDPKTIPQMRFFKMEIAEALLVANLDTDDSVDETSQQEEHGEQRHEYQHLHLRKRTEPVPIPLQEQRYRRAGHLPEVSQVQKKCRFSCCKKKTKIICTSCKIHLCLTNERNCYKLFHTPEH